VFLRQRAPDPTVHRGHECEPTGGGKTSWISKAEQFS
jgi:hypothetical protein